MKQKNIKTKLGIGFIVLAIISPLLALVVPFLALSKTWSVALAGFLVAGAPEIFFILGGLLAGKEVVDTIKNRLKDVLKNRFQTALLLVLVYISTMGIGMYMMYHEFGYNYSSADMVKVLWVVELVLSVIAIFFVVKFFSWQQIGFSTLQKKHLLWLLPLLLIIVFYCFLFFQTTDKNNINWELLGITFVTMLLVGFSEELVFRGVLLHTFLDKFTPIKAVIFSAILFSALHTVNLLGGSSLQSVAVQLLFTFVLGIYFGFISLKLKNIIPLMLLHFLWDFTLYATRMGS